MKLYHILGDAKITSRIKIISAMISSKSSELRTRLDLDRDAGVNPPTDVLQSSFVFKATQNLTSALQALRYPEVVRLL